MASASTSSFASLRELGIHISSCGSFQLHRHRFFPPQNRTYVKSCSRISSCMHNHQKPILTLAKPRKGRELRLYNSSVELGQLLTSDDEEEMSQGLYEAIEELERMTGEPSDILGEMNDRLSARELQLVLVYFAQDGRDSWCALEVFEWLKKENRVDSETMELMVSIMCSWVKKLIEDKHDVSDVVDLLVDMDCVGLKPSFSMMEKVISLYWEMEEKNGALMFVKEVLKRGIAYSMDDSDEHRGGPAGYLAWKMMIEGNFRDAVKFVIDLRESGFMPSDYAYFIAMTAVVKEMNELAKALRKLKGFAKSCSIDNLDIKNLELIEKYRSDLLSDGVRLSSWLIQNGSSTFLKMAHEKLLALYICAGHGVEAERQLWEMKITGKEADRDLYNIVLAICASQKEAKAVSRLLTVLEATSSLEKKRTLSWLLRGYIKGGHFNDAAEAMIRMIDLGLHPEYMDRAAVLQGLSKRIRQSVKVETYLKVCKRLADANLASPCIIYKYIKEYKLWIIQMI